MFISGPRYGPSEIKGGESHELQRAKRKEVNRARLSLNHCKPEIEAPVPMPVVVEFVLNLSQG